LHRSRRRASLLPHRSPAPHSGIATPAGNTSIRSSAVGMLGVTSGFLAADSTLVHPYHRLATSPSPMHLARRIERGSCPAPCDSPYEAHAERPEHRSNADRFRSRRDEAGPNRFEKLLLVCVGDFVEKGIHPRIHGCFSVGSHPPPRAL